MLNHTHKGQRVSWKDTHVTMTRAVMILRGTGKTEADACQPLDGTRVRAVVILIALSERQAIRSCAGKQGSLTLPTVALFLTSI